MEKIIIGLITLTIVALSGSALAWDVNVNIGVVDAEVDITATVTNDDYALASSAGVDGTGVININGNGDTDSGYLVTSVSGSGELYAAQGLGIAGCLADCVGEECDECPEYTYGASSYAAIRGNGQIVLAEGAGHETNNGDTFNGQILVVRGNGTFTAGMMSSMWIEEMEEPVIHAMGAYGTNVDFCVFGIQAMDDQDGTNSGFFVADLNFLDEGCEEVSDCDQEVE